MKKFYYFLSAVCLVVLTVLVIACNKQDAQPICENVDIENVDALKALKINLDDYNQRYFQENPKAKSDDDDDDKPALRVMWADALGAAAGARLGLAGAIITGAISSYIAYEEGAKGIGAVGGSLNVSSSVVPNDINNRAEMVGRLHNEILLQLIQDDANLKQVNVDSSQVFNRVMTILESKAVFAEFDLNLARGSRAVILSDISDIRRLNADIILVDEATISRSLNHFAAKYPETSKTLEINRGYLVNAFEQGDIVSVRKYTEGYDKIINNSDISIYTKRELQAVSSTTKNTTELWRKKQ